MVLKSLLLGAAALVASVSAAPASGPQPKGRALFDLHAAGVRGQTEHGFIMPSNKASKVETFATSEHMLSGSMTKKISYGSVSVNPMSQNNGMQTYFNGNFEMPCSNCYVYKIQAGIDNADGSYANANTSMWLHHMVVWDNSRTDTVCGPMYYGMGNRWFASGNERTIVDMSLAGTSKTGYYLPSGNKQHMLVELMNQGDTAKDATMWVQYWYVQGQPAGWTDVNTMWLDISGCWGVSDEPALSQTGSFQYTLSPGYTAAIEGTILEMGGHLHDGGVSLPITKNGAAVCTSYAFYGQTPGYWDASTMSMKEKRMSMKQTMSHISTMSGCVASPAIGMMKMGDVWSVQSNYNYQWHAGMLDDKGKQMSIMGIAVMYVAKTQNYQAIWNGVAHVKVPETVNGLTTPNARPNIASYGMGPAYKGPGGSGMEPM